MINKKLDEISTKLDTIKVLVQNNEYLKNVEKKCDEVNDKYTQTLEVAQDRFDRIQKAIDYIENCNHGTEEYKIYEIATNEVEELLDILKGEE